MTIAVIGAGLVGLAAARALRRRFPGARIVVLEKESGPGVHQSTHNSGVLHCGLHYRPGSARARLAVRGIRIMTAFCAEHRVPHEICGKVVAAASEEEVPRLRALHERGVANGLTGLRWLSSAEAREREPHLRCVAALLVPEEGIVDFGAVVRALVAELTAQGVEIVTGAVVTTIARDGPLWRVEFGSGSRRAEAGSGPPAPSTSGLPSSDLRPDFLVSCAGLQADRVATMAGERVTTRIVPFRGDYWMLVPDRASLISHMIYPVPDPAFPFLGLHFTRLIGGGVKCGPSAVLALAREGYRARAVSVRDARDAITFPGLWRFALRHPRVALHELRRAGSRIAFLRELRRLVPDLERDDLASGPVGVRAQAMRPDGTLVDDFEFLERSNALHVLNAPSPAATAALAIGEHIAERVAFLRGL